MYIAISEFPPFLFLTILLILNFITKPTTLETISSKINCNKTLTVGNDPDILTV